MSPCSSRFFQKESVFLSMAFAIISLSYGCGGDVVAIPQSIDFTPIIQSIQVDNPISITMSLGKDISETTYVDLKNANENDYYVTVSAKEFRFMPGKLSQLVTFKGKHPNDAVSFVFELRGNPQITTELSFEIK